MYNIYIYTYINIEFIWIHDIHISLVIEAISCPKYPIVMNSTKAALTASDSVAQVLATSGAHLVHEIHFTGFEKNWVPT